jgi:hypothetical protein
MIHTLNQETSQNRVQFRFLIFMLIETLSNPALLSQSSRLLAQSIQYFDKQLQTQSKLRRPLEHQEGNKPL